MRDHGRRDDDDGGTRLVAHVPALDGLRGLAVAIVLWFHADHLRGGYLGVDLFFTLSGYLITSLLVAEWRRTGGVALVSFWARRVRRLLPALVVTLVAVGLMAQWKVLPAARGDLRDSGLATLLYVANWRTLRAGDGYWDQALNPSWLEHTWSLAIEEQFYLLWPLVVIVVLIFLPSLVRRGGGGSQERRVRLLGTVAAAGAVLSAGGMIAGSLAGATVERLYLGTDTRVAAILLGAAAACFQRATGDVRRVRGPDRRRLAVAAAAASVALVVAWATLEGTSSLLYRGGLLACGLAAVVVIVDVTTPGPSLVAGVLGVPPLRALGAISYGLYLYHWPIYRLFVESDLGLEGWALTAAQVGTSLAAAVLSYRLLEQPILQRRWRWPSIRLAPLGAAAAVLALLFGSIGAVDGAPAAEEATRPDLGPRSAAERVLATTTRPADGASTTATTAPVARVEELIDPVVLVVGDSVPFAMAEEGFIPQEAELGLATVNGASPGCSIVPDEDATEEDGNNAHDCRPEWAELVTEYRPDVVMVLFGAFGSPGPRPVEGRDAFPCEPAYDRRWHDRLAESVELLASTGAAVDLITAPTADVPPRDPDRFHERQRCINDVIEAVAEESPYATSIDLAEHVCPDDDCHARVDGINLRADGLHFTGDGALLIARWLAPRLKQVEVEIGAQTSTG